ncbi:SAP30-binding protein [Asbolus verrucosus]|uniref:SAP30-binding protein n=1 Tax=Asbolus verrucosus TaxID=1661398 RepID=A0A482W7E1_ASBVE|nr:SAP30-binding protein [Asbolus verrucosus]
MSQSTALASLTATYTDSEGEEEINEETGESQSVPALATPSGSPSDNKSTNSSRPSSPAPVRVTTKVAKLVSYHDDTIASDEEGEADDTVPHHEVIMLMDNENSHSEDHEPLDKDGVQIPPEPPGHCSIDLQDKIAKLYEKMQNQQLDMNALIQKRKDFRNPSIYEKLIQFCAINELGTNYPPTIYDPLKWDKESYYEELAKVQKVEMDKREKERKSKVEFVSGTKKQDDDSKKRKSKWDQPGGNSLGSQNIKPAGLVQPSLTSSATGTKGTVISAFGSLPKKPRP